jgi:hypothetical protein
MYARICSFKYVFSKEGGKNNNFFVYFEMLSDAFIVCWKHPLLFTFR